MTHLRLPLLVNTFADKPHRIFLTRADDFVFWLTDTTRFEPALCGSQAAWAISGTLTFDLEGIVSLPANVIDLLRAIYDCGSDFIEEEQS